MENLCRGTVCGIPTVNLQSEENCIANFSRFTNLTGLEERNDTTVPYEKNINHLINNKMYKAEKNGNTLNIKGGIKMGKKIKKITYISIILTIIVVLCLIAAMIVNINKMYSEYREQALDYKTSITEGSTGDDFVEGYEEASSSIGKTVEESKKEENKTESKTEKQVENKTETKTEKQVENKIETKTENKQKTETKAPEVKKQEAPVIIPDPSFIKPVEGEIIKEYSKENLIYSETLKEWTTHTGVDIQAELTTVVKAASEGTVKSIKNDPRYGLTVIIEHVNGFETRYSNLLTAEFVKVGEKVTSGQTIGTVGNTASFEVLDKSHIHFEILKNSEYLDPTSYIK